MKNEFIYPLRVHIEDTDYGGVVYHSNYLNFMERARSEWIDELGMGISWQREHQLFFAVRYANIEFLKPAKLHERLEVVSSFKEIRQASIIFDQYLRLATATDTILSKAEIKVACVGINMRPCPIPETDNLALIRRMIT